MAAQQYDGKDIKALKTPFYTERNVNNTDTQQIALLSFTWHKQHINVHQLFKAIRERSAGKIKPEFCIVPFPIFTWKPKIFALRYDWNLI